MPSICRDCKLGYGHQLNYCPGCPNKMEQLRWPEFRIQMQNWEALRREGWRIEGDTNLFDFYLNDILLDNKYKTNYWDSLIDSNREKILQIIGNKEFCDIEKIHSKKCSDNEYFITYDGEILYGYIIVRKLKTRSS